MTRRIRPIALGFCGLVCATTAGVAQAAQAEPPHPASLDTAIVNAAARHGIPESLVRRIVMRESKYNAHAHNRAYWGLMQISYPTARSMGFRGSPQELLNPVVNLRYAVPYLANAFVIAGKRQEEAVRLYAAGYYFTARNRGLLGALRTADSSPLSGVPDEPEFVASAAPAPAPAPEPDTGIFGALFGPREMPRDAATQQVVYASAAPAAAPPVEQVSAPPTGKSGADATPVVDKNGDLHPPKSWQRDGGTTVMARGEQAIEQTVASKLGDAGDAGSRRRHARKSTQFAALDAPATAQAYTAAPSQDPRLLQADSQAAISQATTGQPQDVAQNAAPDAAKPGAAADDTSTKKHRKMHARRGHHRETETAVSQAPQPAVLSSDQQAAAAPEPQPASAAPAMEASPPATGAAAPTQDAGAAAQAQFEQASGNSGADVEPSRRQKRHAHRSHGRKATEVAAQAPSDGQAPRDGQSRPAAQQPAQ